MIASRPLAALGPLVALLAAVLMPVARAADTELANAPLFTSSATAVKPNLMFILDDSGSMKHDYLPDNANYATTKYGKFAAQCNGVAYNPNTSYILPVDSTGAAVAAGSLSALSINPNDLTDNRRTLSAPGSFTVPTTIGTDITVTVSSSNRRSSWYESGDLVTLFSTGSTDTFITASVRSWDRDSGQLVVRVTANTGTGTLSSGLRVGDGQILPKFYYRYTGTQIPLDYRYNSSGLITTSTFYQECNSAVGSTPGSGVFTRVDVTTASSEAQNYANWFAYYRTRMAMTKSAITRSFTSIGDRYRIGYSTISETEAVAGTNFLDIATFNATQKASFYSKLNAAVPSSWTPLRGALSKAGQYFAKKAPGQTVDPIQYSCQKNFTILSTDGYWNTQDETTTYGPFDLAGSPVGQRDGAPAPTPRYDGGSVTVKDTTTWTSTRTVSTQTDTTTIRYSDVQNQKTDTYSPKAGNSGTRTTTYSRIGVFNNSGVQRCASGASPCYIRITAPGHTFAVGNTVVINGVTTSGSTNNYNGTKTITAVSGDFFFYQVPTRPSSPTSNGTSNVGSCPAGQGYLRTRVVQTDTFSLSSTTVTTGTQQEVTTHAPSTQSIVVTPWSRVVTKVNGVQTGDTGEVAGSATTTTTSLTPAPDDVGTSTPFSTSATTTTATATPPGYTPTVVSDTTASTCSGSAPSNSTTAAAPVASAVVVANAATAGTRADTPVSGPTVTTIADATSETTRVTTSATTPSGGSTNSLADVAAYYYETDLRNSSLSNCTGALGTGTDVCGLGSGDDTKFPVQNMTTFTLGLGVSGTLRYDKDYLKQASGDYADIVQGTKVWPIPSNGAGAANIDDLWHAAVNGRGQYFSAGDPSSLVASLEQALLSIEEKVGTAAAAATSTLQPVEGDNDVFVAQFTSAKWVGDLLRYEIDPSKGTITTTPSWSAAVQLKSRNLSTDARTIKYFKRGTGNTGSLRDFTYTNLDADGLEGLFDGFCGKTGAGGAAAPAQCSLIVDKTAVNTGSNLVSYLAGTEYAYYRTRDQRLGDIVNGAPIYVGPPRFKYTENDYAAFQATWKDRDGVVYVAANDGMLHAFDRDNGKELWAFMPSEVLPDLYKLADTAYSANHRFFVDGAPQVGDIYVDGAWRTILVGGMNAGGRSYYALDITDPANPSALWEFNATDDPNLGLTFGNPVITKRKDGTWVVVFASGYNNNIGTGDGNGHLFVLNAKTGEKLLRIPTQVGGADVGSPTAPSGLAKINPWVDSDVDNTAKRFYGGDLLGNLWRFDLDGLAAPNQAALRLAEFKDGSKVQPITVKPALAEVNYLGAKYAVVYVGTGRYLGTGDLSNSDQQSVYALKDKLTDTGLGDVRTSSAIVQQTLTTKTNSQNDVIRTITTNKVEWNLKDGWRVDLLSSGERVNVNPVLAFNVLSIATSVPSNDACEAGGSSFSYRFDIGTGSAVAGAPEGAVGVLIPDALIVGQTVVQLKDGSSDTISTRSDGKLTTQIDKPSNLKGTLRRTSWRELVN